MTDPIEVVRETKETQIRVSLDPWKPGKVQVSTGLGFYDHMWTALAHHGKMGLIIEAQGDLHIDDHHTVEDVALTVGQAFLKGLGDRTGITRFGHAYVPMDESLARASIDLVKRPFSVVKLGFVREKIGDVSTENLTHALESFAQASQITLHVEVLYGANDHHKSEAAFKSVGRALHAALQPTQSGFMPSTKGVMG